MKTVPPSPSRRCLRGRACLTALTALLATVAQPAPAAVIEAWVHRYTGPANYNNYAQAVSLDATGNVVVTGTSGLTSGIFDFYDYYTAKYAAADGALLWEQRYNGPANGYDEARAVAVDNNGNVVVTGNSTGVGSDWDCYTAKYAAADGTLLWEQRYNGPANREDKAAALAIDASGDVVVTGHSFNTNPFWSSDYYTAKYAAEDGTLLWERLYNGPMNFRDRAQAVAVDASGDVVVAGHSDYHRYSVGQDFLFAEGASYAAKYASADGALQWEQRSLSFRDLNDERDPAITVAADAFGDAIVAGHWIFNTCPPLVPGCAFPGCYAVHRYYTAKYAAADGALQWERQDSDGGTAMVVDADGNAVVTGSSIRTNGCDIVADYYTAKYAAADGALLWEQRYNGPANGDDYASSLALGPNGTVAVTGSSNDGDFSDYATVVYREVLPPVSIAPDGSGGYFLRFTARRISPTACSAPPAPPARGTPPSPPSPPPPPAISNTTTPPRPPPKPSTAPRSRKARSFLTTDGTDGTDGER